VLEAGDGSATAPFYGEIINFAWDSTAATDKTGFCKDRWAFRGDKAGLQRLQEAEAASDRAGGRADSGDHLCRLDGARGDVPERDDNQGDDGEGSSGDGGKSNNRDSSKGSSGDGCNDSSGDGRKEISRGISCEV